MAKDTILKPVMIFGYCLIIMGCTVLAMHYYTLRNDPLADEFRFFDLSISFFHFFIGFGILLKKKWGYYCFRFYLYLISIGFPVGTFIGLKMLKYIDKNNVKQFFGKRN